MVNQLSETLPHGMELVWHLLLALLFAVLAHVMGRLVKAVTRIPSLVVPRIKALDVKNPVVLFCLQFLAALIAIVALRVAGVL